MEIQLEELKAPIKNALCIWGSPSHHIVSKRRASPTRELEKKGGFVGFHLRGNGMHIGNGIHHP
jgi:hypothetical protein